MFVFPIVNEVRSRNLDRTSNSLLLKCQFLPTQSRSAVLNFCDPSTRLAKLVLIETELSEGTQDSNMSCADLYISVASSSELLDSNTAVDLSDTWNEP